MSSISTASAQRFPDRRIDSTSMPSIPRSASPPAAEPGTVVAGRRADRRPGPSRPLLALRTGRRPLLLRSCCAPDRPLLTLALGLATAEAIAAGHRHRLRSALAQRPDARQPQGRRHPGATGRTAWPSPASASTSTTPRSRDDLGDQATSLRLHAGREIRARRHSARAACPRSIPLIAARTPRPSSGLFAHASSYAAGRRVTVRSAGRRHRPAPPRASTPTGFLIVRKDDGTDTLILAGGVRAAGS